MSESHHHNIKVLCPSAGGPAESRGKSSGSCIHPSPLSTVELKALTYPTIQPRLEEWVPTSKPPTPKNAMLGRRNALKVNEFLVGAQSQSMSHRMSSTKDASERHSAGHRRLLQSIRLTLPSFSDSRQIRSPLGTLPRRPYPFRYKS